MKQNYETKLQEAEQVYHRTLAAQSQAEKRQHELQQDIRVIEQENAKLEKLAEKHVEAHKAIDKLYASIFTGPTPGFPDEDEREEEFIAAEAEHQATSTTLKAMSRANKHTQSLKTAIEKAHTEMKRADYETDSAFFIADYTQLLVEKAARFVGRAMQLQTDTTVALPKPLDSKLVEVSDTLQTHLAAARRHITAALQTVYPSRSVFYDLTQNTLWELQQSLDAQSEMANLTKQYEATAKESVKITSRALEDARQSLHEIRQGAFEITVGFGAAAPAYNECCDRAEWYANDVYAACDRIPAPTVDEASLPPLPSYDEVVGQ
jgi:DNA repair exonuclease SbcCD ATPase subunit